MRIELKKCTIELLKPQLIFIQVKNHVHIEEADVLEIFKIDREISDNKEYVVVLCTGEHTTISKKAQELTADPNYSDKRIAFAMVVKSLAHRLMGNFFIKLYRPKSPTRVFNNKEEAFEWAEEMIAKYNTINQ